jgi:hypothetical protein
MRYQKPEVLVLTFAFDEIQASEKGPGPYDFPQEQPSVGAYEADE